MALELGIRRFSILPDFIQTGNGEPRKAHFLGKKEATPVEKQDTGRRNDRPPRKEEAGRFRDLASISLGEVDEALNTFMPQLVPSPTVGWIAKNYFCQLQVRQRTEHQSPVLFGRVTSSFPGDGNVQNIKQMEMLFPQLGNPPDLLSLRRSDILFQEPIYSYCAGVKMYLSESELADFARSENIFIEKGFAPIYATGSLDLLEMNEQDRSGMPWLNVIGSEWFASIPPSLQPEIRERLKDMLDWNKVLLNYHPNRHSLEYLSLNEELDFNFGFTRHYLIAPRDTGQVLQKVEQVFGEIFMQGVVRNIR